MPKILEVCVDNLLSAKAAINGGADRLELCSSLVDGGLTPTPGLLKKVQEINDKKIPVFCMIRCRSSNFVYTDEEFEIMKEDVKLLTKFGANGFVFGALNGNGELDFRKCFEMVQSCFPLPVTFHRAFDICVNPLIQIESLIDIGYTRVLTSGQEKTALEGIPLIKKLIKRARDRIIIIAAAGISIDNIKQIAEETDAEEFHGSFKKVISTDDSDTKNDKFGFGTLTTTHSDSVSEVAHLLRSL